MPVASIPSRAGLVNGLRQSCPLCTVFLRLTYLARSRRCAARTCRHPLALAPADASEPVVADQGVLAGLQVQLAQHEVRDQVLLPDSRPRSPS